jgi:hypothetical protein
MLMLKEPQIPLSGSPSVSIHISVYKNTNLLSYAYIWLYFVYAFSEPVDILQI